MESSDRLRQLRAQHRLVADHLAWLEAEIAREEAEIAPISTEGMPKPIQGAMRRAIRPETTPLPVETEPDHETTTDTSLGSSAAAQAQKQKRGCIILAILVTAVLLFLIWGLPQLLYSD